LLESELGLRVDKALQQHDWRIRPIDGAMMAYLAADVSHLEALEARLWAEIFERGIEPEVVEETAYRIACAADAAAAPPVDVPYLRIKGADRLEERELAALRAVVAVREREAEARDVPPYTALAHETLLALARIRPKTAADVARVRGVSARPESAAFVEALARALATAPETLPDDERERLRPPRLPPDVVRARKGRESRLMAWRRAESKRRGVDEQVLLPGHCLRDVVVANASTLAELARVPGMGAFRVERDGDAILRALREEGTSA
jgi:ribonuclease D